MSEIQLPQHKIDKLLEICDAHGNQPGELINVLHKAQHLFGIFRQKYNGLLPTS